MQDLFFYLIWLGIALLVLVVILWAVSRYKRKIRHFHENPDHEDYTDQYFEDPLADTGKHNISDRNPLFDPPLGEELVEENYAKVQEEPDNEDEIVPVPEPPPKELIIAFFVVAVEDNSFKGNDIFAVMEEVGLNYGRMKIFHHYGVGEVKVDEPIFSVANLHEPGTFDPQAREEFTTRGLVLFLRLPGPFGGRVAFELMLNNAQRLADSLNGLLQDEQRRLLDPQVIESLRQKIIDFERQQISHTSLMT